MNFLKPPKFMCWSPNLDQHYQTNHKFLLVSGASFTASTNQLECPASWPGYVLDRCRFESAIDLSYPGVGNEYIADSIVEFLKPLTNKEQQDYLVIIMWSGLGWSEEKVKNSDLAPQINGVSYARRPLSGDSEHFKENTKRSYQQIISTYEFLKSNNIATAFTNYANTLFPPCLPRNDLTCNFTDYLTRKEIDTLQQLPWIPANPKDYLYDYGFFNDYPVDNYHPPAECNLAWTDRVLLPEMLRQGLIEQV